MESLNESQKSAVMYNEGPSLVVAGAGSGKTRVLTYKIAYLISLGLKPYNILAITFTNKAAKEMKERIATMVDPETARRISMGTFHSIFVRILRTEAEAAQLSKDFTILDADDSKKLIKDIVKEMKLDDKTYKPASIAGRISKAKNALVSASEYASSKMRSSDQASRIPETYKIYAEYEHRLKASNSIDFDDMLMLTQRLFSTHPEVLEKYQQRFQFILVDEYQDTNFAQYVIIKQLAEKHHRVCVVGDDAQSIYAFRGANIENILQFTRNYPEAKVFKLEQNYRSTQNIVSAANSLIDKNLHQIKKTVFSENETGEKVEVVGTASDREEASMVCSKLKLLKSRMGGDWNDSAVLYRTNSQSRVIEEALLKSNIPYVIYGGHSFYQRTEIKDVLAYLKLLVNEADEVSLSRIINKPSRGIGTTTLARVAERAHALDVPMFSVVESPLQYNLEVNAGTAKKLTAFAQMIREFQAVRRENDAFETADYVIKQSGILSALDADSKEELESKKENVLELLNGVKQFVEEEREEGRENADLLDYLNNVVLLTDADTDGSDAETSRVRLMTVHAAKGLEFKNVFVVGLEDGLFPCSSALTDNTEMEEERRLLYVAITRAMRYCVLSYASCRFHNGKMEYLSRSRFIDDIDRKYLNIKSSGIGRSFDFSRQDESFFTRKNVFSRPSQPQQQPSFRQPSHLQPIQSSTSGYTAPATQNIPQQSSASAGALKPGVKIQHEKFGIGRVAEVNGSGTDTRVTIDFEYVGRKVLLLKYAKITIIG
ncbi:MAG: UvrD-helicase domain-containing protein [Bacteroidales bacterium]|nr:UvrD-helicase domain-containing protein [Bacteroidales bacterium]MDY6426965.1 UvrD-helicase domain-containing protein [Bacteroidales bacterium]